MITIIVTRSDVYFYVATHLPVAGPSLYMSVKALGWPRQERSHGGSFPLNLFFTHKFPCFPPNVAGYVPGTRRSVRAK